MVEVDQPEVVSNYRGFVTPHHPRTDEISAMAVYEYREMERLSLDRPPTLDINFFGRPECSIEELENFLNKGYLPIEIGEMRYHAVGASSATEALIQILGLDLNNITEGEQALINILARRNQSGYMNQFHMSIPRILKDVYCLSGYNEVDVVNRFKDIVHAFLEFENCSGDNRTNEIYAKLSDLAERTQKCQFAPFTPARYLRDLCHRDEPTSQVREKVEFWIVGWDQFQSEFAKARAEWPNVEKLRFSFNGLQAAAVITDNQFFSKVAFSDRQVGNVDLLITMSQTGHTAIMVKGKKNTSPLHRKLETLEPDIWHQHGATGNLINGSLEFPEVVPTMLKLSELADLVIEYPPQ